MGWLWYKKKPVRFQIAGDDEDFLLITWDSCRFDAYQKARTPRLDELGEARRGWSMATYTLPSHMAMFQGFLPHVYAPEPFYNRFCQQLWRISHRNLMIKPLVTFPSRTRNIICGFRDRGYYTVGTAAMDWFRDTEALRDGFTDFDLPGTAARKQNDWLFEQLEQKAVDRPAFVFINYGETHSPFRHEGMPGADTGVDQRFRRRALFNQQGLLTNSWSFDEEGFGRQIACAEYLDRKTGEMLDWFRRRGRPTTVVICGDHGECFGENGLWGHAVYHEKVMEVPILIGRLNAPPHPVPEVSAEPAR